MSYEPSADEREITSALEELGRVPITAPDPFRQLHRRAIQEVVRRVVAEGVFPAERFIDARAREMFSDDPDVIRFTGLVLTDLERLHEGNILRYRLRKPQLDAWQALAARR